MVKKLLVCLLVFLLTFQEVKGRAGPCIIIVTSHPGGVSITVIGDCNVLIIVGRQLTVIEEEPQQQQGLSVFKAIADEIFMALKAANPETEEEIKLTFELYSDTDDTPTLLVKHNGEQLIVLSLDEVKIDEDRTNMIQSEEDAQLLQKIETQLTEALLKSQNQP